METGILEVWENGKKTGEIVTMGDLILKEQDDEKKKKNDDDK